MVNPGSANVDPAFPTNKLPEGNTPGYPGGIFDPFGEHSEADRRCPLQACIHLASKVQGHRWHRIYVKGPAQLGACTVMEAGCSFVLESSGYQAGGSIWLSRGDWTGRWRSACFDSSVACSRH